MSQRLSKQEKFLRVSEATLGIVVKKGLSGVTIAGVARSSGVSRAWIYSNIAKTKQELIQLAARRLSEIYTGPFQGNKVFDLDSWLKTQVQDIEEGLDAARRYPWLLPLYFQFRGTKNLLGQTINQIEERYMAAQIEFAKAAFGLDDFTAHVLGSAATDIKLGFELRGSRDHSHSRQFILPPARQILRATALALAKNK
jgi:AcrR family transcriptional regulator